MSQNPPPRPPPGSPPGSTAKTPPGASAKTPPGGPPGRPPPGSAAAAPPAPPKAPGAPPGRAPVAAPPAAPAKAPPPPPGRPVAAPVAAAPAGKTAVAPAAVRPAAPPPPAAKAAPGVPSKHPPAGTPMPRGTRTALGGVVLSAKNAAKIHSGFSEPVGFLVDAMLVLTEIVILENDSLKRHDMVAVSAVQERKLAGHYLFEERLIAARRDENMLRTLPADQRDAVIKVWRELERRTQENVALLRATIQATEIVFTALKDAAVTATGQEMIYSRQGEATNPMPAYEASMAYNTVT